MSATNAAGFAKAGRMRERSRAAAYERPRGFNSAKFYFSIVRSTSPLCLPPPSAGAPAKNERR
jgi:hypothetical protein